MDFPPVNYLQIIGDKQVRLEVLGQYTTALETRVAELEGEVARLKADALEAALKAQDAEKEKGA